MCDFGLEGNFDQGAVGRAGLAGGARRCITFFACAKKVTKESTPRCRRNPEGFALARAAKELAPAGLRQLSPAFGCPDQGKNPRRRQRGKGVACDPRATNRLCAAQPHGKRSEALPLILTLTFPPLRRLVQGPGRGAVGEDCLSPKGEFRSRPGLGPERGNPKGAEAGCVFFGYFLCTSKESNASPGAPGQPAAPHPSQPFPATKHGH